MSNQKGFSKVAIIIIVFIIISGAYFVFSKKDKNIPVQNIENQNSQSSQPLEKNLSTETNPKDYSLANYPLKESPIYTQLDESCSDPEASGVIKVDTHLVKNRKEIIIPSLLQLLFTSDGKKPGCTTEISIFSAPKDGKYLYLKIYKLRYGENLDFEIYSLNLLNLSLKKMSFPVEIGFFGMNDIDYKILPDGKRIVKWSTDRVYLINLETNSYSVLYTAPQNQWLIASETDDEVFSETEYNINVDDRQIIIGIYSRDKTKNNTPVERHNSGEKVELMFIQKVTIPIPPIK